MIARLLIKPFGTVWNVKRLCISENRLYAKVSQLLYGLYQYENNSSIAYNSIFKSEPFFPHGMKSIFISGAARIGRNSVIFQQTTIGSNTLIDTKTIGAPIIGDNVYIGSGATIVGAIKIGDNVRIGANTVVYEDVPNNSVVVSGTQRIITKKEVLDNRFYSYHKEWVYYDNGKYHTVTNKKSLEALTNANL